MLGLGNFEGNVEDSSAIFYVPPESIQNQTEQAIISIKITDTEGREATDSIVFNIIAPASIPTITPSSGNIEIEGNVENLDTDSSEFSEILFENFDKGLNDWGTWQTIIEGFDDGYQGKCIKIYSENRRSSTWLSGKTLTGYSGTIVAEAMIKSENIQQSPPEGIGKFLIRIVGTDGVEDYQGHHFTGSFDWIKKQIIVHDIQPTDEFRVQFGLEKTPGTLYVDEVRIFNRP